MKSSAAPLDQIKDEGRTLSRWWALPIKAALGVVLLAALIYLGQVDLSTIASLAEVPAAVFGCMAMVALTWVLGALRWLILLRVLGISIPFFDLFCFINIAATLNVFLLGSTGGDAARILYVWRALGRKSGRAAISVFADRVLGLLGLVAIALVFTAFNWRWMRHVPPLAALGTFLLLAFAASAIATGALFLAPNPVQRLVERLSRWPRVAKLATQATDVARMIRTAPVALLTSFAIAVLVQVCSVLALLVIAEALNIGRLSAADYMFAAPIALVANALPLTPNGLGVGEVAFDQICRWLEPVPTAAAYSSIFFAFRSISALVSLSGFVTFVVHRPRRQSTA
jgi:uncharacterized protein (TIRG00374 family)